MLNLLKALRSTSPEEMLDALAKLEEIEPSTWSMEIIDGLVSLLYLDPHDNEAFRPVVDKAVELLQKLGEKGIPFIIEVLKEADLKASIRLSIALGKMGSMALPSLEKLWNETDSPMLQAHILYSVSKMRDREAKAFLPHFLEGLHAEDRELRDTAARGIGKLFEHIPPEDFTSDEVEKAYDGLFSLLSDPHAPIRAKAIRSLGKMAKQGVLTPNQRDRLQKACFVILGKTSFEWDRAYIVRVEAEEALSYLP